MLNKQKIVGSLGGNLIETIVGFIVILYATRTYSQEEVGIYFIVIAIAAILNNLKEGFLQNGFVKYLVESNHNPRVEKSGFVLSAIGDAFKIFIFTLITLCYDPIQQFTLHFIVYTIGYSLYRWVLFVYKSRLDMSTIMKGNLIVLFGMLAGLSVIHSMSLGSAYLFLTYGIAYILALSIIPKNRTLIITNIKGRYNRALVKKMTHFGKYGFIKEVSGSIAHQASIFISAYFLTLEATSILGLAGRYTILIAIPGASLGGILYPLILKNAKNIEKLKNAAQDGIGKTYALLIPIAIGIIVTAPFVIYFLHGSAYIMAAVVLAFKVLISAFLIPLGSGYSSIMNAINKPKEITRLMIISSITNILLSIILIYYLEIWGAVIAPILTEIVGFYIMRNKLSKIIDFEVFSIIQPIRNYWIFWTKTYITIKWKKLKYQS